MGKNGAEKAVHDKTHDNSRGRADNCNARGDPQNVLARRAERQAYAKLRSALRNAVSDEAEDAHQSERKRHGREDAKQYGEEPLAAELCVALEGLVEGKRPLPFGNLLVGRDGCDSGAYGVQVGERIVWVRTKNCALGDITVVYGR